MAHRIFNQVAALVLVSLAVGPLWGQAILGTRTNPSNGSQYVVLDSTGWAGSQTAAELLGGNLVTINDAVEDQWLIDEFQDFRPFWIGLNDTVVEGVFEWVSGEPVTYTNWAPGEPNDAGVGEDFGESRQDGLWNDLPTVQTRNGVVELPPCGATPASDVLCELVGGDVFIAFTNNGPYPGGLEVIRDGEVIATLAPDATEYIDPGVAPGFRRYLIRGNDGSCDAYSEVCSLVVGIPLDILDSMPNDANGSSYLVVDTASWADAQLAAAALGGNLVTINGPPENQWIVDNLGQYTSLWIGFNDLAVEGTFEWVSGQATLYTNWAAGEPNDAPPGEDLAEITAAGAWNDLPTSFDRRGLVEVDDCGVAAPLDVTCEISGDDIVVTFVNSGPYPGGIDVFKDGVLFDSLADPAATTYTDVGPSSGAHRYFLRGNDGAGCSAYSAQCSVLFVPASVTDLIWSPADTLPGATNDAEALSLALESNGIADALVTDILPADLSPFVRVWATVGTFPNNHPLSAAEGQLLLDYCLSGGRLYISGSDVWGFDPATSLDVVDGIDSVNSTDGSSACDLLVADGQDSAQGLDLSAYIGTPTSNNGGECAWIDHLVLDDAGPAWQNPGDLGYCGSYHDGLISGTASPGDYRVIATSFEFATLGTSDDELALFMEEYLNAFGGIVTPTDEFVRGDCNGDGTFAGLVDGLAALNFQFVPGSTVPPCLRACDANGDDSFNGLVDGLYILNFQFLPGSPPPPAPFPDCGPGNDIVECETLPAACL